LCRVTNRGVNRLHGCEPTSRLCFVLIRQRQRRPRRPNDTPSSNDGLAPTMQQLEGQVMADAWMTSFEAETKARGWKKLAGSFVYRLNDQTLAHFRLFLKDKETLRVQMQTTNTSLNRVSWDLYDLPHDFGSDKDQLTNACKCNITASFAAREFPPPAGDVGSIAAAIIQECQERSQRFGSIDRIAQEITTRSRAEPPIDQSIEFICIHIARSELVQASALVNLKREAGFPGFALSFYGRVERYLASKQM
jgi:hypothetical protein